MAEGKSKDLLVQVEESFMKLPPLPKNAQETLVSVMPWIALIFGVLGVLGGLSGLGLLTVFSPLVFLGGGIGLAGGAILAAALWLVSSALLLAAYPGTKARKMQGWKLLLWSALVGLVSSVVSVSVSGVLMELIGLYLLYQIKSHYK